MNKTTNCSFLIASTFVITLLLSCSEKNSKSSWPPALPGADKNGVATIGTPDLLLMPQSVRRIIDSNPGINLSVARNAPLIELVYHNDLPNKGPEYIGWTSYGDICLASDGKVYTGIGNHWGIDKGECFVYCWDPLKRQIRKVVDLGQVIKPGKNEVHFSKLHAHIIEGVDKKIYFTATLDDGGKAGSGEILQKWTDRIAGGKLFQYDPKTEETKIYADLPKARVTANMKYDPVRNMLYCALEGDPAGYSLGAFDMGKKKWVFQTPPGWVGPLDRNFMIDKQGNVFFNGLEIPAHTERRLMESLADLKKSLVATAGGPSIPTAKLPGVRQRFIEPYVTLWKYVPTTNSISPTQTYFKDAGFRSATKESSTGNIYGTTMEGQLYCYFPSSDKLTLLGSDFLVHGEYVTVCELSPDEKFLYYLPAAHGSCGFSGTPVIQYNIEKGEKKVIAFLEEPMMKAFNYGPGETYGMKISPEGSKLYIGLSGAAPLYPVPTGTSGRSDGLGLTSLAIVHIPNLEK